MCGIIGASSNENVNQSQARLGMLLADGRGGHSTGWTDGDLILRSTGDAERFLDKDADEDFDLPDEFKQFIGHTRYATEGDKTISNTHPFSFPNALGVHNGTIDNFQELKEKYGEECLERLKKQADEDSYIHDMDEIESDSQLLYYIIYKEGLQDAVKQFQGTMALCYFDSKQRIHIYRYDKPLCYGFKDGTLWFGSLKEYLEKLGCSRIKPFTQHAHWIIKGGNIQEHKQLKDVYTPKEKKSSRSDDYDPKFTKERQNKGKPRKTRKKQNNAKDSKSGGSSEGVTTMKSGSEVGDVMNTDVDIPDGEDLEAYTFKAPAYAKAELTMEGEDLILWWFSEMNPNILYVELEGNEDVMSYDLSNSDEQKLFKHDFSEIKDRVMDDYMDIETATELRREKESNAYAIH